MGGQTLVRKGMLNFFVANYFHHPRLHVIIPWPLTVYLNCTPKVCIIVDQLRKLRRPRVSQSVNAGHRWRGKYCFASRGEQIIGEYPKRNTFLNTPGISFSGKVQSALH